MRLFFCILLATFVSWPIVDASPDDRVLCMAAADIVEKEKRLPKDILKALALTESGRYAKERRYAWPWTVNNAGTGYFLDNKDEAIALVRKLQNQGEWNIDVGCMQINLRYHPDAFENINLAFDPLTNARYAGRFLHDLRFEHGTWARAIERYHTKNRERGRYYRKKVTKNWRYARRGKTILNDMKMSIAISPADGRSLVLIDDRSDNTTTGSVTKDPTVIHGHSKNPDHKTNERLPVVIRGMQQHEPTR